MLGAIIGDIAGSRFEWKPVKTKDFPLFDKGCRPTDDSVMTLAIGKAFLISRKDHSDLKENVIRCMQELGRKYPRAGYGGRFSDWIVSPDPKPYNSWGNGSAMRVSPCGYVAASLEEAEELAAEVSVVTHNHPEGIKGAKATAAAIFLARCKYSADEIKTYIKENYYDIHFTLDDIRPGYSFDVSCHGSVPQSLESFFESESYEDAIRNAISLGGDSDTMAAIAGSIAEAYYGIPDELKETARIYLDNTQLEILDAFTETFIH